MFRGKNIDNIWFLMLLIEDSTLYCGVKYIYIAYRSQTVAEERELIVFSAYETTIHYQQSQEVLEQIMEEAIDRYLALHPTVFPIERQDSYAILKAQKSYRSNGELIILSVQQQSFSITSKCVKKSPQVLAWSKNRDNVNTLSTCLKSEAKLLYVAT